MSYNPSTGTLSATDFDSLSDITYKEEIKNIENALNIINQLRGVSFKWKENKKKSIGLIAQEVENVIPEIVNTRQNGVKTLIYDNIIPLLIESVKELQKEIVKLKEQIKK